MKKWENPQVNNLSIVYTKNEGQPNSGIQPRGAIYCECCDPLDPNRFYAGSLTGPESLLSIGPKLLAHKQEIHGYTGDDPYTKTCPIS